MRNEEVKYYQEKLEGWITLPNWDSILEKLTYSCANTVRLIMEAKEDDDCSVLVWKNADSTLKRISSIAEKLEECT